MLLICVMKIRDPSSAAAFPRKRPALLKDAIKRMISDLHERTEIYSYSRIAVLKSFPLRGLEKPSELKASILNDAVAFSSALIWSRDARSNHFPTPGNMCGAPPHCVSLGPSTSSRFAILILELSCCFCLVYMGFVRSSCSVFFCGVGLLAGLPGLLLQQRCLR
ncbi:hypothetical protein DFS34DRAFT_149771 [Phlyctochytrium arcticum]|nr:hypothetical protein DFS34DRAFT_149771 [Phlyctochytrium arcticum]